MSKILGSIQPTYLPWLPYFNRIKKSDVFIFLDNVQFVKNSFHNRNYILNNGQLTRLTIPVVHKFGQKICDVKIDNSKKWREKHWKSIFQSYSKSKYFNIIKDELHDVYSKNWDSLSKFNTKIVNLFINYLEINTKIFTASELPVTKQNDSNLTLIDYCKFFKADSFIVKPNTDDYHPNLIFKKNKIKLVTFNFEDDDVLKLDKIQSYNKIDNKTYYLSFLDYFCKYGDL